MQNYHISFRVSFFLVEIPASKVVKKNNKNEMSKTFFIFFSIPKDLFFGESNIYQNMWDFSIFGEDCGGSM